MDKEIGFNKGITNDITLTKVSKTFLFRFISEYPPHKYYLFIEKLSVENTSDNTLDIIFKQPEILKSSSL